MAFRNRPTEEPVPTDPAHLYRMLAAASPAAPESLWYHQGEILKTWHTEHDKSRDVALELPTGAGKTLVGAVIAEYRRRVGNERTAYLCPTRQLAKQTAERLASYGIPSVALTGPVRTWSEADKAKYRSAKAVAVTTYAHVFNSNPAIDDAELLVLDDAHAAADSVASPWSLMVKRHEHRASYLSLLSVLADGLDPLVVARLSEDSPDASYRTSTYLVSPVAVRAAAATVGTVLREAAAVPKYDMLSKSATYTLRAVEDHLAVCMVYVSHQQILMRPLIPPTGNHAAFDAPARRVYMSATLGAGGELERAFGRRKIARIPVPEDWEKQGTGRRLFCVPDLTTDLAGNPVAVAAWVQSEIGRHGRAVLITPDQRTADDVTPKIVPKDVEVVSAEDVEDDLAKFTSMTSGVLLLTNRYDGIDLPNEDCRLVILCDLPAHGDLQERFLYSSLGAHEVLQERIRARFTQGAGRATRNARDYSTVIVLGANLIRFATRSDVQAAMHPEIHAELAFGWENSMDTTSAEMTENVEVFLAHDAEWRKVELDIAAHRDRLVRVDPPGTSELANAAPHEVAAWHALWNGEYDRAMASTRSAIDALRGGQAPQRYAALWNYLGACWTAKLAEQGGGTDRGGSLDAAVDSYYQAARAAGRGTTWLAHLASPADDRPSVNVDDLDPLDTAAVAAVLAAQASVGRPAKFAPFATEARTNLKGTEPVAFETGLVSLGTLLGADESLGNGGASAAPDSMWLFGPHVWVGCEAKSDAKADGEVGAESARQAEGHLRFTSSDRDEPIPSGSVTLLVSPESRVHSAAAKVVGENVYLVRPAQIQDLADRTIRAWESIRATPNLESALAAKAMRAQGVLPSQWIPALCTDPLSEYA